MKRVLTLALALGMLLSIFSFAAIAEEPITITYWSSGENAVYQKAVASWNEAHPEIQVEYVEYPDHSTMMQKLQITSASGSAELPNVMQEDCCMVPTINSILNLLDLKPYFDADPDFKFEDFYVPFQEEATVDGEVLCMHIASNFEVLFYNKDLFVQAGLDPENPPKTWAEVIEAGLQIKEKLPGITPFSFYGVEGTYYEAFSWEWQGMTLSAGGELFNEDYTECRFNSEAGLAAMDFLVSTVTEHEIASVDTPATGFENGTVAMYLNGTWKITSYNEIMGDNLGCVLMPSFDGTSRAMVGGSVNMVVDCGDDAVNAAAWEFFKHLYSEEVIVDHCASSGELSCRASVSESDAYKALTANNYPMQVAQTAMETAGTRPQVSWYNEWSEKVWECAELALYGECTSQEALDALEAATYEIMAKNTF